MGVGALVAPPAAAAAGANEGVIGGADIMGIGPVVRTLDVGFVLMVVLALLA